MKWRPDRVWADYESRESAALTRLVTSALPPLRADVTVRALWQRPLPHHPMPVPRMVVEVIPADARGWAAVVPLSPKMAPHRAVIRLLSSRLASRVQREIPPAVYA